MLLLLSDGGGVSKVIVNEQNIGYGSACNKGAEAAETEYLFFLNPDTELSSDTIDELYQATKRHPAASAFAPIIRNQAGELSMLSESILVPEKRCLPCELPDRDFEASAIIGAAIFISKRTFEEVGKFDENIFLFYEDDDLSYRLRTQFGPIMIVRSAQLIHLLGQSTPMCTSIAEFRLFHMHWSRTYIVRKYGINYPVNRLIIVLSLKFMLACLLFHRKRQAKYYYRVLGLLRAEDKLKNRLIDKLISRLARFFKHDSITRCN